MRNTRPAFASDYQRMWDLARYARGYLLENDLITREEYAALLVDETANRPGTGSPSARRLESYDELRARIVALEQRVERLSRQPRDQCCGVPACDVEETDPPAPVCRTCGFPRSWHPHVVSRKEAVRE